MATKHSSRETPARIFHKLLDVVPDLMTIEGGGKSKVEGYMDLGLDILFRSPEKLVIALSHYYKHPSGDMIPDPDMEIAVFPKLEHAEALAYQDFFGYQSVKDFDGPDSERRQRLLNQFLSQWLSNLIMQGHCIRGWQGAEAVQPEVG